MNKVSITKDQLKSEHINPSLMAEAAAAALGLSLDDVALNGSYTEDGALESFTLIVPQTVDPKRGADAIKNLVLTVEDSVEAKVAEQNAVSEEMRPDMLLARFHSLEDRILQLEKSVQALKK